MAGYVKLERDLVVVIVAAHPALSLGSGTDGERRAWRAREAEPAWPRAKPWQARPRLHGFESFDPLFAKEPRRLVWKATIIPLQRRILEDRRSQSRQIAMIQAWAIAKGECSTGVVVTNLRGLPKVGTVRLGHGEHPVQTSFEGCAEIHSILERNQVGQGEKLRREAVVPDRSFERVAVFVYLGANLLLNADRCCRRPTRRSRQLGTKQRDHQQTNVVGDEEIVRNRSSVLEIVLHKRRVILSR